MHDSIVNKNDFGTYQVSFLKKFKIPFLFADKDLVVPNEINAIITKKYIDTKSGEQFYVLKK